MTVCGPIFSVQPWRPTFGDPAQPERIAGVLVHDFLLRRRDVPGVLVSLDDRRFAVTGTMLTVGSARELALHLRKRAARSASAADRRWLMAVSDALARRSPDYRATRGTGRRP